MPVHVVAASESVALNGLDNFAWLTRAQGELFLPPDGGNADDLLPKNGYTNILGAYVGSPSMSDARLISRELRQLHDGRYITPTSSTELPGDPPVWADLRQYPIRVSEDSPLNIQGDNGNTAEQNHAVVWFSNGATQPLQPSPDSFIVEATESTTKTADQWTTCTPSLTNDLDAGVYVLEGCHVINANGIAWRVHQVLPPGGGEAGQYRPGGLIAAATDDWPTYLERAPWWTGAYGPLALFRHDDLPSIDVLAIADTDCTMQWRVRQVRAGR